MKNEFSMYKYEKIAYKNGYKLIAGIDEVGRGSIAGPIVCACVILPKNYKNSKIKDSKMLTSKQRKDLYNIIINDCVAYSIVEIDANIVDKLNPKKSSILGMEKSLLSLSIKPDFVLIDFEKISTNIPHNSIVYGDKKSISIAAASILAKVYRDNLMENLSLKYPNYYFHKNKGYLTKQHLESLKEYGPINNIHRFTYKPIKK